MRGSGSSLWRGGGSGRGAGGRCLDIDVGDAELVDEGRREIISRGAGDDIASEDLLDRASHASAAEADFATAGLDHVRVAAFGAEFGRGVCDEAVGFGDLLGVENVLLGDGLLFFALEALGELVVLLGETLQLGAVLGEALRALFEIGDAVADDLETSVLFFGEFVAGRLVAVGEDHALDDGEGVDGGDALSSGG